MGKGGDGSGFPVWPSTSIAPVYQQRFEHRVKATVAAGQVLLVDLAPFNDIVLNAYIAPGNLSTYAAFTPGTFNGDIALATAAPLYFQHAFLHYNSLLASLGNGNAVVSNKRQAPKMRYTSFCVEVCNLSQISSLNGMLRACRIATATQNPAAVGPTLFETTPFSQALTGFYENPNTQHVVGAEASHALCAHALPTQMLAGQFYVPSGEGAIAYDQATATQAWANYVYNLSSSSSGDSEQGVNWTTLRLVVDGLSATANIEFVVKATCEFIIPPESFLVGAGIPRPLGDFTPILKRAAALMRQPVIQLAAGPGRITTGITGLPSTTTTTTSRPRAKQQATTTAAPRKYKGKNLRGQPASHTANLPAGFIKTIRAIAGQAGSAAPGAMKALANSMVPTPRVARAAIGDLRRRRR